MSEELEDRNRRLLDQHLAHLRIERGLSDNTVAAYRRDLTRYLRHVEDSGRAIEDMDAEAISAWMRFLRTGEGERTPLAASSASRALAAVRGLHAFLTEEGELSGGDPTRSLTTPGRAKRLPHPLDVDQVVSLIEMAGREGGGVASAQRALRDRALLEVLYGLGARISEALGIDLDDIDRDSRSVVLHGKGDKQRLVPVGSYALEAVDAYVTRGRPGLAARGTGGPALFLGSRGSRLTRQAAWQIIRGAASALELEDRVSPHTLRHSYATHLLQGGADVRSVQELLGHASVTTTQLYTEVTVDSLREVHASAHPRSSTGA